MRNQKAMIMIFLLSLTLVSAYLRPSTAFTWSSQENRLTTELHFDCAPAIAQMNDAKVWIVWEKEVNGDHTIYYVTSSNFGASWSEGKNITRVTTSDINTDPSVTQTSDGVIWIVWSAIRAPPPEPDFDMTASPPSLTIPKGNSDTSIITITSINNFNEPVELSVHITPPNVTATLNPVEVTPPPNGNVNSTLKVTVGTSATPGDYTLIVTGKTESIGDSVPIPLEITETVGASSHQESYHEEFSSSSSESSDNYQIYYKTSEDYGASWSDANVLIESPTHDLAPSILQASNGTMWLVWSSFRTGNFNIFYKTSHDLGTNWSDDMQLTFDLNEDKRPAITQTNDGRIWVVWYSNRYGDNEILYKIYDGSSWSVSSRLTTHANGDTAPAITQTIDGTIWIFWSSCGTGPNDTGDIYYRQSLDDGQTWEDRVQFTTDAYEDIWPATAVTSDTKLWVLWTSDRADQPDGNYDVWYRTSLVGDVNNDGLVDIFDLATVALAFGTSPGDDYWNPEADINKDDVVDIDDLILVARNYGST